MPSEFKLNTFGRRVPECYHLLDRLVFPLLVVVGGQLLKSHVRGGHLRSSAIVEGPT